MSYLEYLAARETVTTIGQPVITFILIVSLLLGAVSLYHMVTRDTRAYILSAQLRKISTVLLVIGFIIIAWFHLRIYQTIELVYPPELANYMAANMGVSATSLRFAVPLWIETEKIYFWTLCLSIFLTVTNFRYDFSRTNTETGGGRNSWYTGTVNDRKTIGLRPSRRFACVPVSRWS